MKAAVFVFLSLLPFGIMSQGLVETIVENESFTIFLTGANGTIKWFQSTDSAVWNEISGATSSIYTSTMLPVEPARGITGQKLPILRFAPIHTGIVRWFHTVLFHLLHLLLRATGSGAEESLTRMVSATEKLFPYTITCRKPHGDAAVPAFLLRIV